MKILKSLLPFTVANIIALFIITLKLPEMIPIHIDINMRVDSIGSKWIIMGIGVIPLLLSFFYLFFQDTVRHNIERKFLPMLAAFMTVISWLPVYMAYQRDAVIGTKLELSTNLIIIFPLGLMIIILSNFMGKFRYAPERFIRIGLRTPWTIANETVWKKSHRFAGHTGVAGGILMCIFAVLGSVFKNTWFSAIGIITGVMLAAIIPTIYSYIIYRKIVNKNNADTLR